MRSFDGVLIGSTLIDSDTGEIKAILARPKKRDKETDFYMGKQDTVIKILAKDKELWGQTRAVLDYLVGILQIGNLIFISQKDIAKELNIDPVRVSEAIRKLCKKQIIIKDKTCNIRGHYKMNPAYFWKGEIAKRKEALRQFNILLEKEELDNG